MLTSWCHAFVKYSFYQSVARVVRLHEMRVTGDSKESRYFVLKGAALCVRNKCRGLALKMSRGRQISGSACMSHKQKDIWRNTSKRHKHKQTNKTGAPMQQSRGKEDHYWLLSHVANCNTFNVDLVCVVIGECQLPRCLLALTRFYARQLPLICRTVKYVYFHYLRAEGIHVNVP